MTTQAADRSKEQGFTLLELTAALFIVSIGLFGVVQTFYFGMDKMRTVQEYAIAMRAIENELETLRAQPFVSLRETSEAPFLSVTPELNQLFKPWASVRIRERSGEGGMLWEVTVRIVWLADRGRRVEKRVTTLIAYQG